MVEYYDGIMRGICDNGDLRIMLFDEDGKPSHILLLNRDKEKTLQLIKDLKNQRWKFISDETSLNLYNQRIKFVRGSLYGIRRYNNQKFTKRNPKEDLGDMELIDLDEFVAKLQEQGEQENSTEELL